MEQSRKQTARMLNMSNNLVCTVFRALEDVCSIDIGRNPIIPFGGRCLVKCDESKFNHKAKVRFFHHFLQKINEIMKIIHGFLNACVK